MTDKIVNDVISLIVRELKIDPSLITPETPLFDGGLELDSFAVVELITHVEATFGIQFSDDDFRPENFDDATKLAAVVARYKAG